MAKVRQDVSGIRTYLNYISLMFPYNDEENTWISKCSVNKKTTKHKLIYSLIFSIFLAFISTTISPLIYFYKINLF